MTYRRVDHTDPKRAIANIAHNDLRSKMEVVEAVGVMADRGIIDSSMSQFLVELYGDRLNVDKKIIISASKLAEKDVLLLELLRKVEAELEDGRDWVRKEATYAIARLAMSGLYDSRCLPILKKMLKDKDMRVRDGACYAMAGLATRGVFDRSCFVSIISLLRETEAMGGASFALGCLADAGAFDPTCLAGLYDILNDESGNIPLNDRTTAANALSRLARKGICDPTRLQRYIELLDYEEKDMRRAAAASIAALSKKDIYDPTCLPKLIDRLDDVDGFVRGDTALALANLATKDVYDARCLPRLIELLDDNFDITKVCAMSIIYQLIMRCHCDPSCLPKVVKLLGNEKCKAQAASLLALLAIMGVYEEASLPRLLEMFKQEETKGKAGWALHCLLRFHDVYDPSSLDGAIALLEDEDGALRVSGAGLVRDLAEKGVYDLDCLPALMFLMDDAEDDIKKSAVEAVAILRMYDHANHAFDVVTEKDGLNVLRMALRDLDHKHRHVRRDALWKIVSMAKRGICDPSCLPKLIGWLDGPEYYIRSGAAEAIRELAERGIYHPASLPKLIELFGDEYDRDALQAMVVMVKRSPRCRMQLSILLEEMLEASDERDKWWAVETTNELVAHGVYDASHLPKVIALLYDEMEGIWKVAATILGRLAYQGVYDASCLPRLVVLLDNPDMTGEAAQAIQELAERGIYDPFCLPKLIEFLDHEDEGIQQQVVWAIEALAKRGVYDPSCLSNLIELLSKSKARGGALWAIVTMVRADPHCRAQTFSALREQLDDEIDDGRGAAVSAIGHLAHHGICDVGCLPSLIALLDDDVDEIRGGSLWALNEMAEKGILDVSCLNRVVELLDDVRPRTRSMAAGLLGELALKGAYDSGSLARLIELLHDEEAKWNACFALEELAVKGICDATCLPRAIQLLSDGDAGIRGNAADLIRCLALNDIFDNGCLPKLTTLLDEFNAFVRVEVVQAITVLIKFACEGEHGPILAKLRVMEKDETTEDLVVKAIAEVERNRYLLFRQRLLTCPLPNGFDGGGTADHPSTPPL